MRRNKGFQRALKRFFDVVCAVLGLVVLSPLILFVMYKIWREMGTPIFFNRPRVGMNGKIFKLYKFRTMTNATGPDGKLLPDEERITPIGQKIRSGSLDELPQLLNVIKGELSIVGPRPLLPQYTERYSDEQRRRLDVPQGITGWAQTHGRNDTTWDERLKNDVWYVDNWSFALDIKIILMTFSKVIKREGISSKDSATMSEFMGSEK